MHGLQGDETLPALVSPLQGERNQRLSARARGPLQFFEHGRLHAIGIEIHQAVLDLPGRRAHIAKFAVAERIACGAHRRSERAAGDGALTCSPKTQPAIIWRALE